MVGKDKSYLFYRDFHLSLDLHWFALENNRWPEADKALWSHLVSVQIGGTQCHAPGFEDQVLHACVHGAPWNGVANLRWAADAIIILRAKQGYSTGVICWINVGSAGSPSKSRAAWNTFANFLMCLYRTLF